MASALTLRSLTVDDADEMSTVLSNPGLYEFTGGEPPTSDELRHRYQVQSRGFSADGTERWINSAVVVGGALVGYVQATVPVEGGPAEIAWVIGKPWQGRGYAARAAQLLVAGLAANGIGSVIAHIHPENTASQRIALRLGMKPSDVMVDGEIRWIGSAAGG